MGTGPMVHLVSVHHSFHARVIAARLGSDGILTEVRGASDGPYPLGGEVQLFVRSDDLPVARELLLADQVEAAFEDADELGDPSPLLAVSGVRWAAAGAVVLVALGGLIRVL